MASKPTQRLSRSALLRRAKYARWAIRHLSMDPESALARVINPDDDLLELIAQAEAGKERMAA